MNVTQVSIDTFSTGSGVADTVAKPIVASGSARKAYKEVRVRAATTNANAIFVGGRNVSEANGFQLTAGEEIGIPIEDPSTVYVIAPNGGDYSWLCV